MKLIRPAQVRGCIEAPASKSATLRAIALASSVEGESRIGNWLDCHDTRAMLAAIESLGARVKHEGRELRIEGRVAAAGSVLDCAGSAPCLRMLGPIAAINPGPITLTVPGVLRRPVELVCAPIRELGAQCRRSPDGLSVVFHGPMTGGKIRLDASVTTQVLGGLLIALPSCPGDSVIEVGGLARREYVEVTLRLLEQANLRVLASSALRRFEIQGRQRGRPLDVRIEGSWASAANLLVAGAIAGSVEVTGLDHRTDQPDRRILSVLERAGARVTLLPDGARVEQGELRAFEFDVAGSPDLLPITVALAIHCRGRSRFTGVGRVPFKYDHGAAIVTELGKLGASVELDGTTLEITGGVLCGGAVETQDDPRLAMAGAVALLRASDEVWLRGSECVARSFYPRFFDDLALLVAG